MKHLLLFRKSPIDGATTVEDSAGETVDFLAVPFDNLVNISATQGEIILYIREANAFENSKANLAQVTLTVEPTREIETVKQLWATIRQDNPTGYIEFNSPIRKFPIESIREIKSIKRFTTERFDDGGISNVVEDTTPQLGGDLDAQSNNITNLGSLNGTAASKIISRSLTIACSDETTALTTGAAKATFRMPEAATITGVKASVTTAPVGSVLTVDINESGATILSTKLTIDAGEKTSTTAATAAVISDTSIANDAEITIDIDAVGSSTAGAGLKVTIYYNPA